MKKYNLSKKNFLTILIIGISFYTINAQVIDCVTGPSGISPQQMTIEFTPPSVPCGPFVSYEVWGSETETGAFSLIETIFVAGQTTSIHNLTSTSGAIWYYYIVFNYNCPGFPPDISNTATNAFSNANIEIINIDVQNNPNGIEITWEQSPYSQTVGYNIGVLQTNGTVLQIGSTNAIDDTTFTDVINASSTTIEYTISIIDGCGNPSSYNNNPYNQITWDKIEQDRCEQLISLSWNTFEYPYSNAPNLNYNVIHVIGTDTTVASPQSLTATDFNFFDFLDGDTINFRIEVIENNGRVRSTSEWRQEVAAIVQPPSHFFIEYLTVNNQNKVDVYFYIDTLAEIKNFKTKNSIQDILKPDKLIRKDDFDLATQHNPHKFSADTVSNPNNSAYYYQIVANDSCNEDYESTKGRTIFVKAMLEDFFLNKIEWNEFILENSNITTYRLYRDFGAGMQLVQSFLPGETEFIDNVQEFYSQQGSFCYRVEADYTIPIPNNSDASYTTQSNIFCIEQRPSVYIPNAIMPDGVNNEFKPVIVFGEPTNYSLKIFNRWGEFIYESNNPDVGWFGTKNGEKVITGGYPFNITFTAADGTVVEKKGIVLVVY